MKSYIKKVREFSPTVYGGMLKEAFDSLDRDILYESHIHGEGHILRTMFLAALICQGEGFDGEATKLALLGCSYHDIGRVNDYLDRYHGSVSANMLSDARFDILRAGLSEDDFAILKAAMCSHSDHDSNISFYEKTNGVKNHERYEKVAKTLKDADNLDRVRLGDLNEKYLRQETSRSLVDFAQWLLNNIYEAMEELER